MPARASALLRSTMLTPRRPDAASAITTLAGGAARVAIIDASYWIRTGGTLARSTDTTYETALKNSSSAKTIAFPSSQTIPAGSIGYVSIKHAAVTADVSPPLYVNWDGCAAQPSAGSPMTPTVWYSADSVTGSPDDGTWTQDTAFACFRPSPSVDAAYVARGQRYFWPTAAARWVQVRFDLTGLSQAVTPAIACSSGEWLWVVGMSIIRNMHTNITGVASSRATIQAATGLGDPFLFVTARGTADQQQIIDEQITPVTGSATLRKFLRAAYVDPYINDVNTSRRPYSTTSQAERDGVRSRTDAIFAGIKALGITVVGPDCSFGNYRSTDASPAPPYVTNDLSSANGFLPWNGAVFGPSLKAACPASWDTAFDWPVVSDYAGLGQYYDTELLDAIHPNTAGYNRWRTRRAPLDRLLYGQAAGSNTMQTMIAGLGSTPTVASKARVQSVFDAMVAMYPTSDSTATGNRTTLRATLDALPTS